MQPIFNFSYRKVGGLRFVRIGRFGFTFWVSRSQAECAVVYYRRPKREYPGDVTLEVNHDA